MANSKRLYGSLQRREINIPDNPPEIEHYRFTTNGNLQAYMYENLLYVHYGYNAANTRTYKYSFDLNPNWVNGRLEAVNFNPHTAMFYPNSYLNFNQDGYYTKHYYNGMERIASRLGDQNLPIHTHDPELQDRKDWQDSLIRKNIVEITGYEFLSPGEEPDPDDPKPVFELPQVGITGLQPSADGLYYYHSNHLGSTCYVTDGNASVQQGFLYAPFGEITNEYNAGWQSGVLPKYSFNAKELDEETGMYYYEARYYQPPTFTSRDVLFEEKPWLTPYHYCSNNPVVRMDPSGMMDGDYYDNKGNYLGTDGVNDNKVYRLTKKWRPKYSNTNVNWGGTLAEKHYTELQKKSDYLGVARDVFKTGDDVTDKRILKLHPAIRMLATDFINELNEKYEGDFIRIADGFRTYQEQDALYAKGRTAAGSIVSNAKGGESNHNFGLAFDIVGIKDGKLDYDLDWNLISSIGKAKSFSWGGDWKELKDKPHFENMFGFSLDSLQTLQKDSLGLPILKP